MTDVNVLTVVFVGVPTSLEPGEELDFGRAGELRLDEGDDPYLHRRVGRFFWARGMWWLENLGSSIDLLIRKDGERTLPRAEKWLRVGGPSEPLTYRAGSVSLRSGLHVYELEFYQSLDPSPQLEPNGAPLGADRTWDFGVVPLGPAQRLLLTALAAERLRTGEADLALPSNEDVARRLGWSTTTFNRRLDGLCNELTELAVQGLVGLNGRKAVRRREILVKHVISKRMITKEDLPLLEDHP